MKIQTKKKKVYKLIICKFYKEKRKKINKIKPHTSYKI